VAGRQQLASDCLKQNGFASLTYTITYHLLPSTFGAS